MLFQHTLPLVLKGQKTQTRRVIQQNEIAVRGKNNLILAVTTNGRDKWRVGNTYAVQPGRGKSQVARIKITAINSEYIRRISQADAIAEGFANRQEFLQVWRKIHGDNSFEMRVWVVKFVLVEPCIEISFSTQSQVNQLIHV